MKVPSHPRWKLRAFEKAVTSFVVYCQDTPACRMARRRTNSRLLGLSDATSMIRTSLHHVFDNELTS